MSYPPPLVLYASQTGNAESIAKLLVGDLESKCHMKPRLHTLSDYTKEDKDLAKLANEYCLIIVCSTTGQGDVPDNGRQFLRCSRKLEKDSSLDAVRPTYFAKLNIAVLGLGDTNYDRFCGGAKSIESSIVGMGATRFKPSGYADDGTCLEDVVDEWLENLPEAINTLYSRPPPVEVATPVSKTLETKAEISHHIDVPSITDYDSTTISPSNLTVPKPKFLIKVQQPKFALEVTEPTTDSSATTTTLQDIPVKVSSPTYFSNIKSISPNRYNSNRLEDGDDDNDEDEPIGYNPDKPILARIAETTILTTDASRDRTVTQLRLEIPSPIASKLNPAAPPTSAAAPEPEAYKKGWLYAPGDCISVSCPNSKYLVEETLRVLNLTSRRHHVINFISTQEVADGEKPTRPLSVANIPENVTIEELFTHYLDISETPRKALVRSAAEYCYSAGDVMKCMGLVAKDGKDLFAAQLTTPRVNLAEFLQLIPSCRMNLAHVIEHTPSLKPRYYSISSSPEGIHGPTSLSVAFTIVNSATKGALESENCKNTIDRDIRQKYTFSDMKPLQPLLPADYPASQEDIAARDASQQIQPIPRVHLGLATTWLLHLHEYMKRGYSIDADKEHMKPMGIAIQPDTNDIYIPISFHQTPPFYLPSENYRWSPDVYELESMISCSENDDVAGASKALAALSTNTTRSSPRMLMIGTGTGVTPFIGFLEHFTAQLEASAAFTPLSSSVSKTIDTVGRITLENTRLPLFPSTPTVHTEAGESVKSAAFKRNITTVSPPSYTPPKTMLITGARHRDHDYLYSTEIAKSVESGALSVYHAAFSREYSDKKVYVQDVIAEQGLQITQMLVLDETWVYICGDGVNMVKAVQKAIEEAIAKNIDVIAPALAKKRALLNDAKAKTEDATTPVSPSSVLAITQSDPSSMTEANKALWAKAFILQMIKENKYKSDVWS